MGCQYNLLVWHLCELQGLSQDLEKSLYTQITTINIYLVIQIRYNINIQCHGNYIE